MKQLHLRKYFLLAASGSLLVTLSGQISGQDLSSLGIDPASRTAPEAQSLDMSVTGSFRQNRDYAVHEQAKALDKARRMKQLKEGMAMGPTYRPTLPSQPSDLLKNLKTGEGGSGQDPRAPIFSPDYVEGRDYGPPLAERPEVEMVRPVPTPGPGGPGSDVPEFSQDPGKGKLFSKLFKSKGSNRNPYNERAAGAGQGTASGAPPSAAYPESSTMAAARQVDLPPPPPAPEASPPPPEPAVFREGAATRAPKYSVINSGRVFAEIGGEKVKLSKGTKVKVITPGTDRTIVELYDGRRAMLSNSVLDPE